LQAHDLLKLIGVLLVVVGLVLRLRTTLVVVVAGLVTGLLAGLPLFSSEGFWQGLPYLTKAGQTGIINMLGKAFADNRLMTLFIITLPAIGLAERYGLQEQSAALIRRISAATVGRLQIVYQLFRVLHGAIGIRLNGHPRLCAHWSSRWRWARHNRSNRICLNRQSSASRRLRRRAKTTATFMARTCRLCKRVSCWFTA
jgi:hypothetical protein